MKLQNQENQEIIIVEVKYFPESHSVIGELYGAIGQYLLYRTALSEQDLFEPVFLSIPERIYSTLIQEPIIQTLLRDSQISLIVINIKREVIVKWLH